MGKFGCRTMLKSPRSEFELTARSSTGVGWITPLITRLTCPDAFSSTRKSLAAQKDDADRLGETGAEDGGDLKVRVEQDRRRIVSARIGTTRPPTATAASDNVRMSLPSAGLTVRRCTPPHGWVLMGTTRRRSVFMDVILDCTRERVRSLPPAQTCVLQHSKTRATPRQAHRPWLCRCQRLPTSH